MHILVVTDQHPQSLGGVQVSLQTQRKFLERLGHRMTIVSGRLHRKHQADAREIDLPSMSITRDREYSMFLPSKRNVNRVRSALDALPATERAVDLIHVQGDFWGALLGYRLAHALKVPVVHTMHNNVDEGTRAVSAFAPVAFWALNVWRRLVLGGTRSTERGAWRYLASLAERATVVTAPSSHFAEQLTRHGAVGLLGRVLVTPTGVDDELVEAALTEVTAHSPATRAALATQPGDDVTVEHPLVRFVWLGRFSHEKRVIEMLDAVARVPGICVDVFGSGMLLNQVHDRITQLDLSARVRLRGSVTHLEALTAIARADALLQTSIGFETQGMTVFEALALGTPCVVSDPAIAADATEGHIWQVPDASTEALADTLRRAADELRATRGVSGGAQSNAYLHSSRIQLMLEAYSAVAEQSFLRE